MDVVGRRTARFVVAVVVWSMPMSSAFSMFASDRHASVVASASDAVLRSATMQPEAGEVARRTDARAVRAARSTDCPSLFVLGARGSGEPPGSGALGSRVQAFVSELQVALGGQVPMAVRGLDDPEYKAYPVKQLLADALSLRKNKYFDGLSEGTHSVVSILQVQARSCPEQMFVLSGYSQGAMVMHRAVNRLRDAGQTTILDRIAGMALLADGDRVRDTRTNLVGNPVAGRRGIGVAAWMGNYHEVAGAVADRTWSICSDNDLVCDFRFNAADVASWPRLNPRLLSLIARGVQVHMSDSYRSSTAVKAAATGIANIIRKRDASGSLLAAVNAARSSPRWCGSTLYPAASPLRRNPMLDSAAQGFAFEMARDSLTGHISRDGRTPNDRVHAAGYPGDVAENFAAGQTNAADVMRAWMSSPNHCANVMDAKVEAGFGYARVRGSDFQYYWVMDAPCVCPVPYRAKNAAKQGASGTKFRHWPRSVPDGVAGRDAPRGNVYVIVQGRPERGRPYGVQRRQIAPVRTDWMTIASGTTGPDGHLAPRLRASEPGTYAYRIVLRREGDRRAATSPPVRRLVLPKPRQPIVRLAFSNDGTRLSWTTGAINHERTLATGTETTSSVGAQEVAGNGPSGPPTMSPDQRYAAFWSDATNLVAAPDFNNSSDLFIKDLLNGEVRRIDTGPWGTQQGGIGSDLTRGVSFAPDGLSLAFTTGGKPATAHLYDLRTSEVTTVLESWCSVRAPLFASDGSEIYVEASSFPGAPNGATHVLAYNVTSKAVRTLTVKADGSPMYDGDAYILADVAENRLALRINGFDYGDDSYEVIDPATGRTLLSEPRGYESTESADGRWVASTQDDDVVVTDLMTGAQSMLPYPDTVTDLAIAPDGSQVSWNGHREWDFWPSTYVRNVSGPGGRRIGGATQVALGPRGLIAWVIGGRITVE